MLIKIRYPNVRHGYVSYNSNEFENFAFSGSFLGWDQSSNPSRSYFLPNLTLEQLTDTVFLTKKVLYFVCMFVFNRGQNLISGGRGQGGEQKEMTVSRNVLPAHARVRWARAILHVITQRFIFNYDVTLVAIVNFLRKITIWSEKQASGSLVHRRY